VHNRGWKAVEYVIFSEPWPHVFKLNGGLAVTHGRGIGMRLLSCRVCRSKRGIGLCAVRPILCGGCLPHEKEEPCHCRQRPAVRARWHSLGRNKAAFLDPLKFHLDLLLPTLFNNEAEPQAGFTNVVRLLCGF